MGQEEARRGVEEATGQLAEKVGEWGQAKEYYERVIEVLSEKVQGIEGGIKEVVQSQDSVKDMMRIGPAAVQEVLRVQGELERVEQDRDEWKDGCGQYEHCYKYWERVAGARAGLVTELWQVVKGTRGGQDTISAVYYGDAVGGGKLYYWRHEGTGECSWEWPGQGAGPAVEEVQSQVGRECSEVAEGGRTLTQTQKKNAKKRGKKKSQQ